jgi:hypothetical protein
VNRVFQIIFVEETRWDGNYAKQSFEAFYVVDQLPQNLEQVESGRRRVTHRCAVHPESTKIDPKEQTTTEDPSPPVEERAHHRPGIVATDLTGDTQSSEPPLVL